MSGAVQRANEPRVPRPRHLPGAPAPAAPRCLAPTAAPGACAAPPRPAPARPSRVPARLTASCSRRPRRRRRPGGAANAGTSGDSWCRRGRPAPGSGCGRWGPPVGAAGGRPAGGLGRGAGRGPGRARGGALPPCLPAALPAAAPAARRGPDCQRRPRAGMRRRRRREAGGRGGGPGAGRGWGYLGGPSGPGHPPGAGRSGGGRGRPGPRDWLLRGPPRPGAREDLGPESAPGTPGCASPSSAGLEARRPSCLVPARAWGTGGHSSPSPPLRALQRRPLRPASPPAGASEPDPGPTVADWPERGCRSRAPSRLRPGRQELRTRAAHQGVRCRPAAPRQAPPCLPAGASSGPAPPWRSPPSSLPGAGRGLPSFGQLGTVAGDCRNPKPRFWLATRSGRALSSRVLTEPLTSPVPLFSSKKWT